MTCAAVEAPRSTHPEMAAFGVRVVETCPGACDGTGEVYELINRSWSAHRARRRRPCPECGGRGELVRYEYVPVREEDAA